MEEYDLTVKEVAELLGVSVPTIYSRIREKKILFRKYPGPLYLFRKSEVENLQIKKRKNV